jgi:hypothetical protein
MGDQPGGVYSAGAHGSDRRSEGRYTDEGQAARRRRVEEYPTRVAYGGGLRGGRPPHGRRARSPRRVIMTIAFLGMVAFTTGFIAMWSLGSVIVGGSAFGGPSGGQLLAGSLPMRSDYAVEPLVNLLDFRDLAYVPVKGVHVLAGHSTGYFDRVIAAIDRTELNSMVITVKDDFGRLAFDTDMPLGKKYGTISPNLGIRDLDGLMAKLSKHRIVPIARVVTFKDSTLAKKMPNMAIRDIDGGIFKDSLGESYLNPYNHDAWEYVVQVAEECARRGFREIQFDYVRFPETNLARAVYPGQYCAKEDAIAGFLAYARPRLDALGVWMSADCFGVVLSRPDDAGIGQKLEKLCQNVDVLCPMPYPSHYSAWMLGVDNPPKRPYDIVYAAMKQATERLIGTGAKGRPYLLSADDRAFKATAQTVKAQIQAVEDLGLNEWVLWGGYIEEALRTADGTYNGPAYTGSEAAASGTTSTTVSGQ